MSVKTRDITRRRGDAGVEEAAILVLSAALTLVKDD